MREHCLKCLRAKNACYCHKIKPIELPFDLGILMHPLEFRSKTGSGRMLHLNVTNSTLICDTHFDKNSEFDRLITGKETYLLYPGKQSLDLNQHGFDFDPDNKPLFLLIDGTWPCAKKMLKLSEKLQQLPRISFTPKGESRFTFKRQPIDGCVSSLEAVYELGKLLSPQRLDIENLLTPFMWMVDYQISAQKDPLRSRYREGAFRGDRNQMPKAKRWRNRPVFYSS